MYRAIKYIAASSGNLLSDGSAVPAVILGEADTYVCTGPDGVTFTLDVGTGATPFLLEVSVKAVSGNKVTVLSQ